MYIWLAGLVKWWAIICKERRIGELIGWSEYSRSERDCSLKDNQEKCSEQTEELTKEQTLKEDCRPVGKA